MPYCNTDCMNVFLKHLSLSYLDDRIVIVCDGAAWHKSGKLNTFPSIEVIFIPPYTTKMNPIEQIWRELRSRGFHNEVFQTLEKVVDGLCGIICNFSKAIIRSITGHGWVLSCFN